MLFWSGRRRLVLPLAEMRFSMVRCTQRGNCPNTEYPELFLKQFKTGLHFSAQPHRCPMAPPALRHDHLLLLLLKFYTEVLSLTRAPISILPNRSIDDARPSTNSTARSNGTKTKRKRRTIEMRFSKYALVLSRNHKTRKKDRNGHKPRRQMTFT